jgi:hypothetical protein
MRTSTKPDDPIARGDWEASQEGASELIFSQLSLGFTHCRAVESRQGKLSEGAFADLLQARIALRIAQTFLSRLKPQHPRLGQMLALANCLRLELDSLDS